MQTGKVDSFVNLPKVAVFTDKNNLTAPLVQEIIKSDCSITLISDNPKYWKKIFNNISNLNVIKYLETRDKKKDYSYIVFINLQQEKNNKKALDKLKQSINFIKENSAKTLFIFPYLQSDALRKRIDLSLDEIAKKLANNFGVLYIGEPVGVGMDFSTDGQLTKILCDFLYKNKVSISKRAPNTYPVNRNILARKVIHSLFSFGAFGTETVIISQPLTSSDLINLFKKKNKDAVKESKNIEVLNPKPSVDRKIYVEQDTIKEIEKIISKLVKGLLITTKPKRKRRKIKTKSIRRIKPNIKAVFFLSVFVISPLLLFMAGVIGLIFAKEQAIRGNIDLSRKAFSYTSALSLASESVFEGFSNLPVLDTLLKPFLQTSSLIHSAANLGNTGIDILDDASILIGKMTGSEVYVPNNSAKELALNLDDFYKKSGFLQGEIGLMSGAGEYFVKKLIGSQNLKNTRDRVYFSKEVVSELADLIGGQRQKSYLVIIQNNLELRPTGGAINAFALVTFNKGRVVDIVNKSVYEADQFLTGYVEPPGPIKNRLGEVNWSLRESNWYADFPTSAEKAEWFLDKEIDKQVSGVIAFDLEFIRQLLSLSSPIKINSMKQEINSQNLLELAATMYTSPDELRQKDSFFSELLRESLLKLTNLSEKERPTAIGLFIENLDKKHIQVFFHNRMAQRAISELNWDGSIWAPECGRNCRSDWVSIVESNFSENTSSLEFSKIAKLSVIFEEGLVKNRLELALEYAPKNVQKEDKYKTYIRVIVPGLNGFAPAIITDELGTRIIQTEIEEVRGYKEAGVYIEFEPGSKKTVVFSWEGPSDLVFNQPGEYNFAWRKQAGTFNDPIVLMIYFPEEVSYTSNIQPFLTEGAVLGYNTELSRDFVSRISW